MATTTATKIGFVGLGHMGGNMAARLLAAGYTVYGESRDRQEAQELVHEGLAWRDTPRDAALPASSPSTSAAMRCFFIVPPLVPAPRPPREGATGVSTPV